MPESPEARYLERQERYTRLRDEQRRRSAVLARLRLASFLPAMAALVWWLGFNGAVPAFILAVALLLVFGTLVVLHARVEERAERFEALRIVNVRGVGAARSRLGRPPSGSATAGPRPRGAPLCG